MPPIPTASNVTATPADAARPILEVRDLRTYFFQDEGTVKAVDGAGLSVYAGKTLGIVGESGCGKSTFAYALTRMLRPPARMTGGVIEYYLARPATNEWARVEILNATDSKRIFKRRQVPLRHASAQMSI